MFKDERLYLIGYIIAGSIAGISIRFRRDKFNVKKRS